MVDVGHDAEVAVSLYRDLGDAFLQLALRLIGHGIVAGELWKALKGAGREEAAIAGDGMRPPALQEAARGSDA